jgi:zinc D-Ala-D-Ala carboxypeptidase
MSYPKGKRRESCYSYEPWHYRYVGRARAAAVHEAGVTLRRYLWEHHETAP